jgi:hypothetical protein
MLPYRRTRTLHCSGMAHELSRGHLMQRKYRFGFSFEALPDGGSASAVLSSAARSASDTLEIGQRHFKFLPGGSATVRRRRNSPSHAHRTRVMAKLCKNEGKIDRCSTVLDAAILDFQNPNTSLTRLLTLRDVPIKARNGTFDMVTKHGALHAPCDH